MNDEPSNYETKVLRVATSMLDARILEVMKVLHQKNVISEQELDQILAASNERINETALALGLNPADLP